MTAEAQMQHLGQAHGRDWYWADSRFTDPGPYYWNGQQNLNAADQIRAMRSMLKGQLVAVQGPLQTPMWEAPDGQGGQFADADVALDCWIARTRTREPL